MNPLKWDTEAGLASLNDLHRVIGKVLEDMTGNSASDSEDLLEFIQTNYAALVSQGMTKATKES